MDLTDEDIWHLVCAPFSTSSRELAITHGLPLAQVMRVRYSARIDDIVTVQCGDGPIEIVEWTALPA